MALMGWTLGKKAKACLSTTEGSKRVIQVQKAFEGAILSLVNREVKATTGA